MKCVDAPGRNFVLEAMSATVNIMESRTVVRVDMGFHMGTILRPLVNWPLSYPVQGAFLALGLLKLPSCHQIQSPMLHERACRLVGQQSVVQCRTRMLVGNAYPESQVA